MRANALASLPLILALGCGGATAASSARPSTPAERPHAHRDAADVALLGESRLPTASEAEIVDNIVRITARVRGLALVRPLQVRVAASDAIARHLVSGIEDEEVVELRDLYVSLGMLAAEDDVVGILSRVVGEQVVGFYDPELDLLVIRSDVMEGLARGQNVDPETFVTIAHEVVHALQGQHLDLRARVDRETDTDDSDAYQALVEGDATLGMIAVAATVAHQPLATLLEGTPQDLDFAESAEGPGSEQLTHAPPIIRIGLTAPYIAGLHFCRVLHDRGGFAAVDGAHRRLPSSMEQLMHPEKYLADEPEVSVPLPALPEVTAAGYAEVREDTLGELEVGIYLARGSARALDTRAGAGWGGDRVRVYRRGAALAAVLAIRFDTEADAIEAEAAAHRADTLAVDRAIARSGATLLAVHGFPPALRDAVRSRFGVAP